MAYKGKVIRNIKTGQEIKFLQTSTDTDGNLLEMESVYNSTSIEPPPHYHPRQEELFTVLEGEINVRLNGVVKVLKAGDAFHISANAVHSMWNATSNRTVVNWKVFPALSTEYFLETVMGLTADKKTDSSGRPSLLQVALLANKYAPVYRLPKPSFAVQKIAFALLAPFAYLKGYRADYKKYFS